MIHYLWLHIGYAYLHDRGAVSSKAAQIRTLVAIHVEFRVHCDLI
jgi:hypothetical protein